jgi:hypothetical protein
MTRTDYKEVPPRVDDQLTPLGQSLAKGGGAAVRQGMENMAEVTRVPTERAAMNGTTNIRSRARGAEMRAASPGMRSLSD